MNIKMLTVDVTQKTIDESKHRAICSCPIANSIKRSLAPPEQIPKLDDVSVHLKDGFLTLFERAPTTLWMTRSLYKFDLPVVAIDFVAKWDANEPVSPINFDITPNFLKIRDNITPSST